MRFARLCVRPAKTAIFRPAKKYAGCQDNIDSILTIDTYFCCNMVRVRTRAALSCSGLKPKGPGLLL